MTSVPAITLALLVLAAACKPPPEERHPVSVASAASGREVVRKAGCAACHMFPDIAWPRGQVGSDLNGFAGQTLIAGKIPNRPDLLAAFVRNAPDFVPEGGMPAMPISETEAQDVAAYLLTLHGD